MNRRHSRLITCSLLAGGLLAASLALHQLRTAELRTASASLVAARIEQDVARLERLRAARPTVGSGAKPQADALALLNEALAHARLPATHVQSLTPDSQPTSSRPSAGSSQSDLTPQSIRLTLVGLALPQLGSFLHSWRDTQAIWTITQISLRRDPNPASRDQPLWTASLTLSAAYWAGPTPIGVTP